MKVHMLIQYKQEIPRLSALTHIPEEELTERFDEAEAKDLVCVVKLDVPDWKYQELKEAIRNGR